MTRRRLIAALATLALGGATIGLIATGASDKATAQEAEAARYVKASSPVPAATLGPAIDAMFTDPDYAETRAMVIMHDGAIVAERYAEGYDRDTRFISWSMAKSVTAVLVGIMVGDGLLALDEPAPVPEWQGAGDPRGAITLRQLLHMSSGLDHTEAGDPPYESDEVRMLFLDGRDDMAAYAKSKPLEAKPGAKFEYSTNTSVILSDILTRQLTDSTDPEVRRKAMLAFFNDRFAAPLGLETMTPEFDAAGTMIGGSIIEASARDWARFGEFLRMQGAVGGQQIVSRGWVRFMLTSSKNDPAYGGHIWLNKRRPEGRGPVLFPDNGPPSVFACLGHLGQQVVVSPEQKLVAVRLGKTQDDVGQPIHAQMGRIVALFPRS